MLRWTGMHLTLSRIPRPSGERILGPVTWWRFGWFGAWRKHFLGAMVATSGETKAPPVLRIPLQYLKMWNTLRLLGVGDWEFMIVIYIHMIYTYDDELAQTQCCQMIISLVWTGQVSLNEILHKMTLKCFKFPRWHEMRPAKVVKMMDTMQNFVVLFVQRNNFKGFFCMYCIQ